MHSPADEEGKRKSLSEFSPFSLACHVSFTFSYVLLQKHPHTHIHTPTHHIQVGNLNL